MNLALGNRIEKYEKHWESNLTSFAKTVAPVPTEKNSTLRSRGVQLAIKKHL